MHFAVRHVAPGKPWIGNTGGDECCLVLLAGHCRVEYTDAQRDRRSPTLGPRRDVFADIRTRSICRRAPRFASSPSEPTELADGRRAGAARAFAPRVIRPEDCGFEIRGGGNATRQIVDIMPPAFPADRLLVCEVFTPAGNWSSYPPHKHDVDRPPGEVKLEEIYYYRFAASGRVRISAALRPHDPIAR